MAFVVGILKPCRSPPTMPLGKPPPNKIPASKRSKVKRLYERGVAVSAIADSCAVSRRTVADWAKAGNWTRPGNQGDQGDQGDQVTTRAAITPDSIDVDVILAETIMDLRAAMTAAQRTNDYRPVSNIAGAIVKCLEVWERRHPASPAALAKLALEMNTTPEEFQYALAEQWRLINNGND